MLNGIKVLNESYVVKGNVYSKESFTLLILVLVGMLILATGIIFTFIVHNISGIIILILGVIYMLVLAVYSNQPSDIKQYQVTISDDVSMVEFNERYDVIKVEGKIWTIVEKEEE